MVEQVPHCVRLTPAESCLLSWLVRKLRASSRGDAIRRALYVMARYHGANSELMHIAKTEREEIRERTTVEHADGTHDPVDDSPGEIPFVPGQEPI